MRRFPLVHALTLVVVLALYGCGGSPSTSTPDSTSAPGAAKGSATKSSSLLMSKPVTVEAGTVIAVRLDTAVSSKTSNPGDSFDATVAEPVLVNGKEVIPQGAKAKGKVTVAQSAGRFKGHAALDLTLESITISGDSYDVATSVVVEAGKGRGKRTAIGAGGGAAAGAIIGAIAGGGKGAAIGAIAGGGAGTAGAALTGNRDITLAAESKLNFKLTKPLEVKVR